MGSSNSVSRREFLSRGALAGVAFGAGVACSNKQSSEKRSVGSVSASGIKEAPIAEAGKWLPFPEVEARGTPLEIGTAIGAMTRERIRKGIELRRAWFEDLKSFALADRKKRLDGFVAATRKHHPDVLAELEGMAKGAGLPLDDILVLNLQVELGTLKAAQGSCEGCSTLHLIDKGRALLAHNEDGHDAYRPLMTILRLKPRDKPAITALGYPGIIPGCVPAMNSAGIVMTTNFIGADKMRVGIPRYVLGRAALTATSIGRAVTIVTNKEAAHSFHANFGSLKNNRLLAVDVAPGVHAVKPTEGIYLQTNHFVLRGTAQEPQSKNTPGGSSDSRYRILDAALKKLPPIELVKADTLIKLLSSHEAITKPYSPCRHPDEKSTGRTLATALFDLNKGSFILYEGNPCEGRRRALHRSPTRATAG